MGLQKTTTAAAAALGMVILILDGKTALVGAQEGIDLCLRTVIPSLFPFFILSSLLVGSLDARWLRPVGKLCGIPAGAEALLLTGFLGGYPTGAQCVSQARSSGKLTKAQAERMIAVCSNAGPSFLFGMVSQMFTESSMVWLLWAVHILSAVLVGMILPREDTAPTSVTLPRIPLPQALSGAVGTIALVCGWVVFFRIGITFLNRWILWLLPEVWQVALCGLLELSNGCCALHRIASPAMRFLVCSGLLACGGVCVTMQTASVTRGLSMKYYIPGKLLQTLLSLALASVIQLTFPEPAAFGGRILLLSLLGGLLLAGILRKKKINSGIPRLVGV